MAPPGDEAFGGLNADKAEFLRPDSAAARSRAGRLHLLAWRASFEIPSAARSVPMNALPANTQLTGAFWTWVVPPALFGIALLATWLLYRHFAGKGDDE